MEDGELAGAAVGKAAAAAADAAAGVAMGAVAGKTAASGWRCWATSGALPRMRGAKSQTVGQIKQTRSKRLKLLICPKSRYVDIHEERGSLVYEISDGQLQYAHTAGNMNS